MTDTAGRLALPTGASPFDALRRSDDLWSARDLMPHLGYERWERFQDAITRARISANNVGEDPDHHFRSAAKVITGGRWGEQTVVDVHLTRHGAYILAMNGDVRKPEIAAAQAYFAIRTRDAELSIPAQQKPQELTRRDLARMVIEAEDRAEAETSARLVAESRAAELAPAAESWNILATAHGDYLVADAAKILSNDPNIKVGQNRLYRVLSDIGWLYRGVDRRWRAYQQHVDNGRLSLIAMSHYHPRTAELVVDPPQIRITVKGLGWLHQHLGGASPISFPAHQMELTT